MNFDCNKLYICILKVMSRHMERIIEMSIENCRAIKKADIELNGITVVSGINGCGKTTLIKIIAGYLTEYKGNILINKEEDPTVVDFLRKRVTYIRQGDTLLNMSLKDNIILGRDISEEKFLEVCNLLKNN